MTLARRLADARRFAVGAHGDQPYGERPYAVHLDAVRSAAFEHGVVDEEVLVATLLHDVVEDTPVTRDEVAARFGERVADLVDAVSDPDHLEGREAKKAVVYPRIRAVPGATTVKLADRLANVRACIEDGPKRVKKLETYRREWAGFREALRPGPEALAGDRAQGRLWASLEALLG